MLRQLFVLVAVIVCFSGLGEAQKGKARLTYYHSYAPCCKGNPNYNPKYPTTECTQYSACKYVGLFAGASGKKSFDWVKKNNIVSFYDSRDKNGVNWKKNYANKKIVLTTSKGKKFEATILDTCGNLDCKNCCFNNAKPFGGFLVDLEYYTALRIFGSVGAMEGSITFEVKGTSSGGSKPTNTATCKWKGHCLNDPCVTYNDCDGNLVCKNKKCAKP